ncbi:MAG: T9SS type A sorting domain-containing protein [Paludibacter sp.]
MKIKLLLLLLCVFSMVNAQITWDFKTGVEGWGSYGDDVTVSHDGSENLVLTYTGGADATISYPTIYNDTPVNVANVNFFYMKFAATNWPKSSVLVNIYFEMGGNNYYANQTMNVSSGEFSFNIRTEVQHTWSVLPATGTPSRIRIEIPHNSELAGSNWNGASIKIDKISFLNSLTTGLSEKSESNILVYPNPVSESFQIKGGKFDNLSIYNATGKLIKSVNANLSSISVADFAKGLYFVKIHSNGITKVEKLIVE